MSSAPQGTQNMEDKALCQLWGRDRKALCLHVRRQEERYCENGCHPQALKGFQLSEFKGKEMSFKLENLMGVRRSCVVRQPRSPGRGGHERCPPRTKEPCAQGLLGMAPPSPVLETPVEAPR